MTTEDVCRVFNILVKTCSYSDDVSMLHEVLGRLRHSIYSIQKEHIPQTMVNLLEIQ
jgi:hypothetical protein